MIVLTHRFHTVASGNWKWEGETLAKESGFLYQLQSSSFLLCFKILLEFFTLRLEHKTTNAGFKWFLCIFTVCDVVADLKLYGII